MLKLVNNADVYCCRMQCFIARQALSATPAVKQTSINHTWVGKLFIAVRSRLLTCLRVARSSSIIKFLKKQSAPLPQSRLAMLVATARGVVIESYWCRCRMIVLRIWHETHAFGIIHVSFNCCQEFNATINIDELL